MPPGSTRCASAERCALAAPQRLRGQPGARRPDPAPVLSGGADHERAVLTAAPTCRPEHHTRSRARVLEPQYARAVALVTRVEVGSQSPERFASVLSSEQMERLRDGVERARQVFDGRVVWHVNSTARGGGVAEMLSSLLPYARGTGVDARWDVITGDAPFLALTKRTHNRP